MRKFSATFCTLKSVFFATLILQVSIQVIIPIVRSVKKRIKNVIPNRDLSLVSIPTTEVLKPRYSEPQYSEFQDIVNKTQLPFRGFIKQITFDIVNYSI